MTIIPLLYSESTAAPIPVTSLYKKAIARVRRR